MSSYVIVDVGDLADLLVEIWSSSSRHQNEAARQADIERLRREKAQLDEAARQAKEKERRIREEYEASLHAIESRYGTADVREQARQLELFENRRHELQTLARTISKETESLGAGFLSDFTNYHDAPALYQEIAELRRSIQAAAEQIIQDAGLITEYDAESRFEDLEEAAELLETSYDQLVSLFARHALLREEAKEKQQRFSVLLAQLANGAHTAVERVEILPRHLPGAAAEAQAVRYAVDVVRHYLLGPESFYLSEDQRGEISRLYELREAESLSEIAGRSGSDLRHLNEQFRAAKKRSLDSTIFENRLALERTMDRYLMMYETVHGSLDGVRDISAEGSLEAQMAALNAEIRRLERRYMQILRQRLLEDTLERALSRSRTGMQVKRVGAADTTAGNRRTLYQIGSDGMAIEVYTDARGQVLIESGGIVEKSGPATAAQKETIGRNNAYFCEHELPAILASFEEELDAADVHSEVKLRREPEEDRLHTFTLDAYPGAQGALIIGRDGTIRRGQQQAQPQQRALEGEQG